MKEVGRWDSVCALSISCSVSTIKLYSIYFPLRGWHTSSLRCKDKGSHIRGSHTCFLPGICLREAYLWLYLPNGSFIFFFQSHPLSKPGTMSFRTCSQCLSSSLLFRSWAFKPFRSLCYLTLFLQQLVGSHLFLSLIIICRLYHGHFDAPPFDCYKPLALTWEAPCCWLRALYANFWDWNPTLQCAGCVTEASYITASCFSFLICKIELK